MGDIDRIRDGIIESTELHKKHLDELSKKADEIVDLHKDINELQKKKFKLLEKELKNETKR